VTRLRDICLSGTLASYALSAWFAAQDAWAPAFHLAISATLLFVLYMVDPR
jgi:hypothetical protein